MLERPVVAEVMGTGTVTTKVLSVIRLLRWLADEHGTAVLVVTRDTRMRGEVNGVVRLEDGAVYADDALLVPLTKAPNEICFSS